MQKGDLVLAYLLTSIDPTFKVAVRKERFPSRVWNLLRTMFRAVLEASIDAKMSRLHSVKLDKSEKIVGY